MARSYRYGYLVRIQPTTKPALQDIAAALGFLVSNPGATHGNPSPADMLDALAALYRDNPAALVAALEAAGLSPALLLPAD